MFTPTLAEHKMLNTCILLVDVAITRLTPLHLGKQSNKHTCNRNVIPLLPLLHVLVYDLNVSPTNLNHKSPDDTPSPKLIMLRKKSAKNKRTNKESQSSFYLFLLFHFFKKNLFLLCFISCCGSTTRGRSFSLPLSLAQRTRKKHKVGFLSGIYSIH